MSPKYSLNKQDIVNWLSNTLIFLAPALIIFITAIQNGTSLKNAGYILLLWIVNTGVDISRKYTQGVIPQPPIIDSTNPLNN